MSISVGLCQCGCGLPTSISRNRDKRYGYLAGEPRRFVKGHDKRNRASRAITSNGYVVVPDPRTYDQPHLAQVQEHILVVELALGRSLPEGAEVHHFNGDKTDNRPENLIVCQDRAYHMLLHSRQRALEACGNANWHRCWICGRWEAREELRRRGGGYCHLPCETAEQRVRRGRREIEREAIPA